MGSTYRVKKGDSMSHISKRLFHDASRWPDIARANGLNAPYRIFVGQELVIPASGSNNTLPRGDTRTQADSKPRAAGQPRPSDSNPQATSGGETIADSVWWPSFEFIGTKTLLEHVQFVQPNTVVTVRLLAKGSLKLISTKTLVNFSVLNLYQLKMVAEADARKAGEKAINTIGVAAMEWETAPGTLRLRPPSFHAKQYLNGEEWYEVSAEPLFGGGVKVTYEPRKLTGKSGQWVVEGVVSLEVEIRTVGERQEPGLAPAIDLGDAKLTDDIAIAVAILDVAAVGFLEAVEYLAPRLIFALAL